MKRLRGPKGTWILGNAREFQSDKLGFLARATAEFGDVFSFRVGPLRAVVVNDLSLLSHILIEQNEKYVKASITRDMLGRIMGQGIMVSEGDIHRRHRRLVQGGFDSRRVQGYVDSARRRTLEAARRWQDGMEIDVGTEMAKITMTVISDALFGADLGEHSERIIDAISRVQQLAGELFNSGFTAPAWIPTPKNLALRRAVAQVDSVLKNILTERLRRPEDRGDILSTLALARDEAGLGLTDEQICAEVRTLFFSGFETTANALTWTWHSVASNPSTRIRLSGPEPTATEYATRVIKESMRLYPPIWAFNRSPIVTDVLGGYALKHSDLLLISPYLLHRDARHFPDPERFDPERFSTEREASIPRLAYLPFGAGPRSCIGARLALLEASAIVTTISQRFRLLPSEDGEVELDAQLSLRPKGGLRMRLRHVSTDP